MTTEEPKLNTVRVAVAEIHKAVEAGLNIICATCPYYHKARLEGNPNCGRTECGGPVLGRDFPTYTGQIPRNKFSTICLMCGDTKLSCLIVVPGIEQKFGFCHTHAKTFDNVSVKLDSGFSEGSPLIVIPT